MTSIEKIVSGGQTGVDRAALDAALDANCPCGGWCPAGRRAEDGVIPCRYPLAETPSAEYEQRTEWNVRASDGTLVIARGEINGGTAYTLATARRSGKPVIAVNARDEGAAATVRTWIAVHGIRVLNVAGPRESKEAGIYRDALILLAVILQIAEADRPKIDGRR